MAYTQKKYARINWKNRPSTVTPLGETNLNKMDVFLNEVDNALITMEAAKLNISTANSMIASITFDKDQGIMTVRQLDGTEFTFDWNVEKIPVSFTLSEKGVLTMTTQDGTQFTANIADLITNYSFGASATISMIVVKNQNTGVNRVSAEVKRGSLTEEHLNLEYREEIVKYRNEAHDAASDSLTYSKDSKRWAVGDEEYEGSDTDNAKYYKEQAESFSQLTSENADSAKEYSDAAKKQADISTQNANNTAADRTAVESAKQEVENMVSSIPEDYTALDQHVQDLDNGLNTKAPAIRMEAKVKNGEPTELLMPGESGLQGLTVYGKSTQRTTTGANLFPILPENITQGGGMNSVIIPDGSIVVNGTPMYKHARIFTAKNIVLSAGMYSISGGSVAAGTVIAQCVLKEADGSLRHGVPGVPFEVKGDEQSIELNIHYESETLQLVNDYVIRPMLNKGKTALPFEPYTGGIQAPNPDYPQEIESVGEEVGITCVGKNLLNCKNLGSNNVTIKTEDKGRIITVTGSAPFAYAYETLPEDVLALCRGKSIYLHSVIKHDGAIPSFQLAVTKSDGTKKWMQIPPGKTSAIVNVPDNAVKINVELCVNNAEGRLPNNVSVIFSDSMISLLTDDAWEPCKSNSQILPTPNGLPGIPVTSGGNYTDKDGQQWVCDTIEWDRASGTGEYVQRVSNMVINDKVTNPLLNPLTHTAEIHFTLPKDAYDSSGCLRDPCISNRFRYIASSTWNNDTIGIMSVGGAKKTLVTFRIPIDADEQYFVNNPTAVQYILATPIRTPLTADQIKALESLHTFSPTSIISNDQGADMQVIYAADTKAYIDSKIDALSKTILDAIAGGN